MIFLSILLFFQAQNCLTNLYKLDKVQFRQTMREYVNKDSLNNIVDFLHALLGFCMEPITDSKYAVCMREWVAGTETQMFPD